MSIEVSVHLNSESVYLRTPARLHALRGDLPDASGWTPLMYATDTHHDLAMHDVLDGQADIHACDPYGTDALWLAVNTIRAPLVRMLLASGADPSRHGLQALLETADEGLAMRKKLQAKAKSDGIKLQPQPCMLDTWHRTTKQALVAWFEQHWRKAKEAASATQYSATTGSAGTTAATSSAPPAGPTATSALRGQLWSALERRDVQAVTQLLDQGVSPNLTRLDCSASPSPLIVAAEWGSLALVRLLLDRGADVHYSDVRGNTALIAAGFADTASVSDQQQIIRLLLEAGSEVNATNHLDQNALHTAIISRCLGAVRELLSARIDLDVVDLYGETSVSCALFDGPPDFRILDLLIAAGVHPNGRSPIEPHMITILWVCGYDNTSVERSHLAEPLAPVKAVADVVSKLIERDADVTLRSHNGNVALHRAAGWGDPALIRLLLQDPAATAATINAQTYNSRYSPLMEAAAYGCSPRALHLRLLLAAGADTELRNDLGQTALLLAAKRAQTDILKVLLEEGKADPRVVDYSGKGALDVVGTCATKANMASIPAVTAMLKAAIAKRQQAQEAHAQAAAAAKRREAEQAERITAELLAQEEAEKARSAKAAAAKKEKKAKQQQQKARAKEQQERGEREERERKEQREREESEERERKERERKQQREKQQQQEQVRRQQQAEERRQQQEQREEEKGEGEQREQRGAKAKPHASPTPPQRSSPQHSLPPEQQQHQQQAPGSASSSSNKLTSKQQQQALGSAGSSKQASSNKQAASSSSQAASSSRQAGTDSNVSRQAKGACTAANNGDATIEELGCVVCMDAARNMVLVPCGHVALCLACCEAVQAARNECPMCRETIVAALELKLA